MACSLSTSPLMADVTRAAHAWKAVTNRIGKVADLVAMPPYLRRQRIVHSSRRAPSPNKVLMRSSVPQVGVVDVDVGREKLARERQEGRPVDDCGQTGVLRQARQQVKLSPAAGVRGSGCHLVHRPKQTAGEGPVEDSNHRPAFVRHSRGRLRGSGFCWLAVGHAASQRSVVLPARTWLSICRRYAREHSALRRGFRPCWRRCGPRPTRGRAAREWLDVPCARWHAGLRAAGSTAPCRRPRSRSLSRLRRGRGC
jgi:hypothetical protein